MRITRSTLGALIAAFVGAAASLSAQGVTTGAISGHVTGDWTQPIEGAQVTAVNKSTGARAAVNSQSDGRYYIQGLEVGGPYTVSVRRIGMAPQEKTGQMVSLGQATRVDFQLA